MPGKERDQGFSEVGVRRGEAGPGTRVPPGKDDRPEEITGRKEDGRPARGARHDGQPSVVRAVDEGRVDAHRNADGEGSSVENRDPEVHLPATQEALLHFSDLRERQGASVLPGGFAIPTRHARSKEAAP